MKINKYISTFAVVLVFSVSVFAHSNEEIENELLTLHGEIEKNSSYSSEYDSESGDKLTGANAAFSKALLEFTSQHAGTLDYSFPKLSEKVDIKTSNDSGLRVYSWDTLDGGTMHFYATVYQFRGVEGVFSTGSFVEEGDPGGFVMDVYFIETKTGTVYLVATTSRISTSYNTQAVSAFQIDGNSLSDGVKIFKTASGTTGSIGFAYDFFSVVDRAERPIRLFKYDPKTKTLRFPVVIEDEKTPQGRVTDKEIVYRYDGQYFVKVGTR